MGITTSQESTIHLCEGVVPRKVQGPDYTTCENPLSLSEIHETLKCMHRDKSLGYDGLPMEFFLTFQDFIKDDILHMFKEDVYKGKLSPTMNRGLIQIIPKEGNPKDIQNWRPITLLIVSYKLLAKFLASHLKWII